MRSEKIQGVPPLASQTLADQEGVHYYDLLESSEYGVCPIDVSLDG